MLKPPYENMMKESDVSLIEQRMGKEVFYKISNVNLMRPFFMSIVSDSNHWLFLSSNGGISAGRKNSEFSLFPYYTDDKITESAEHTGCKTIIRITQNGDENIWEPFSIRSERTYSCQRNLYKNQYGNKVIFEEINLDLNLAFRYEWNNSNQFGFVRKATLLNQGYSEITIQILDGFQNLVPYGVGADLQNAVSNLADAYKRSELVPESGLGIFALSAIIVDKAEPSEALKANTIWSTGLDQPSFLLSTTQINNFRNGEIVKQEEDIKGEKGAFLVCSTLNLPAGSEKSWYIVANVNQSQSAVIRLSDNILQNKNLINEVLADVEKGTKNLVALNAAADGIQYSADDKGSTRHFSNVLFNIMRGGIFDQNYQIEKEDFLQYVRKANPEVFTKNESILSSLPNQFSVFSLRDLAEKSGDSNFERLTKEYLPLKFSRRHGDPSRPWNKFSINTQSEVDGSKILDYEGNWRDIFQNWEALAHSYPEFIEGMIFKFLNASTFEGYNPYRVTKSGFDWETIEPENPWSYIGYWGDHQIIYLLKLLEIARNHKPEQFQNWLVQDGFVYANVPYKIKPYDEILKNPKDTIEFDHPGDKKIHDRMAKMGADGTLLQNTNGGIYQVNFSEKILATVLSKLSNLVPDGGIWMNTQRPEWNDANNALVGNGLSMVTVCYLRRFLSFFIPVFEAQSSTEISVSEEVYTLFSKIKEALEASQTALPGAIDDAKRKTITDSLGMAGSNFRHQVYKNGFSGNKKSLKGSHVLNCFKVANAFLENAITQNRKTDKLYHTYNLISYNETQMKVGHLSEMLEGQVAVLSSGFLTGTESLDVLDALRSSALYREDQNSYILYPNKNLPRFLQKNTLKKESAESSTLLKTLLEERNLTIVEKDIRGNVHFNGNFRNANELKTGLEKLGPAYQALVEKEKQMILDLFEEVFNHKEFTGRSGTFFGYEGLGSIYWHMVSKLLLAVQETSLQAIENKESEQVIDRLIQHYYQIQDGIGVHKSPELYGAFPTDPYSHTPFGKGAQQPGMTGQVKEDILCRNGELGITVKGGKLIFNPQILKRDQFVTDSQQVDYVAVNGSYQAISLPKNALLFTCCQVPVIYVLGEKAGLEILRSDGFVRVSQLPELTENESKSIFQRTGEVQKIIVHFKETQFRM